jgi:hypothetical protein
MLKMLQLPKPSRVQMPPARLHLPKILLACKVFWTVTASWSGYRCRSSDKRPNTSLRDVCGEMLSDPQTAFELFVRRWMTDLEHPLVVERLPETSQTVYWAASTAAQRSLASLSRDVLMVR